MIPVPTTARDIPSINRILRTIRQKAADATINPIVRRLLINTADSTVVSNTTTETNYSTTKIMTRELMRAGYIIDLKVAGIYSNSGVGTHTLRFRVKLGTTNAIVFAAITLTGVNSNAPWTIEARIVIRTAGSSGTLRSSGVVSVIHGGATPTLSMDIQVDSANVTLDTVSDQTLQISVVHGVANVDTTSRVVNFIVDIMQ